MVDRIASLLEDVEQLRRRGKGCKWCQRNCLLAFASHQRAEELKQWHTQWQSMSNKEQDAHLLWIFQGSVAGTHWVAAGGASPVPTSTSSVSCDSDSASDRSGLGRHTSTSTPSPLSSPDVSDDEESVNVPQSKRRRLYKGGAERRESYAIHLLGVPICRKAALCLISVGEGRVQRVLDGRVDMRTLRPQQPGPQLSSVWRFLWTLYHNVAEGLPDKFSFATGDVQTGGLVVSTSKDRQAKAVLRLSPEEEDQSRAIAAHAMYLESGRCPSSAVSVGPGIFRGPLRFLHPGKRVYLFWEYEVWAQSMGIKPASLSTFLRAFKECEDRRILKIRGVGDHAVCDECKQFKDALRAARLPADRKDILEQYAKHIAGQWLDRQVYENASALSVSCRKLLDSGTVFRDMAASVSQVCIVVDGMDQAKFRVPRMFVKTKALSKLERPALHVHGCWAHGFGYHLAVSDQDVMKNSSSNIEVVSLMLEHIFVTHGGLPGGLHLEQDNASNQCKNQKMLKWAIKLVALGIFKWCTLGYLRKGHTHCDIDGTFGQLTVRLSRQEFDDDLDVVNLLNDFLKDLGIDALARESAKAYKLDECTTWDEWCKDIRLDVSNMTGPRAPHFFKVCQRSDLVDESTAARCERLHQGHRPAAGDVVLVTKHYLHDTEVLQVCTVLAESSRSQLSPEPPAGIASRRYWMESGRSALRGVAEDLLRRRHISQKARDYLVQWASKTRAVNRRPSLYNFLSHRTRCDRARSAQASNIDPPARPNLLRLRCRAPDGTLLPLPTGSESEGDDAEGNGDLVAGGSP